MGEVVRFQPKKQDPPGRGPRSYTLSTVLEAAKYLLMIRADVHGARRFLTYCATLTALDTIIMLPPDMSDIVDSLDLKKVMIREMGGEVSDD